MPPMKRPTRNNEVERSKYRISRGQAAAAPMEPREMYRHFQTSATKISRATSTPTGESTRKIVITSYSIHYTKLYDHTVELLAEAIGKKG